MKQLTLSPRSHLILLPTTTEIEEFEKKYNISLPEYFKLFLLNYSGQFVLEKYFPKNNNSSAKIDSFIPLKERGGYGLTTIEALADSDLKEFAKVSFIAFAMCGPRVLYMKITGDDAGDIYYFMNHHDPDNPYKLFVEGLTFEGLINGLITTDPNEGGV